MPSFALSGVEVFSNSGFGGLTGGGGSSSNNGPPPPTPTTPTMSLSSPLNYSTTATTTAPLSSASSSVRLSCLSPNGKAWHSLVQRSSNNLYLIETIFLARSSNDDNDDEDEEHARPPLTVQTKLPTAMQAVLAKDAPCEIFCVDAGPSSASMMEQQQQQQTLAERLCLYTGRVFYMLSIAFSASSQSNNHNIVAGRVVSVTEPLERHWLETASFSTRILRARPAPQRNAGAALHCPSSCLAVLTEDRETGQYQLALLESSSFSSSYSSNQYHYRDEEEDEGEETFVVKVPLTFYTELVTAGPEERIVDFCFAQCNSNGNDGNSNDNSLALLASISVLLLKGNGDVLLATPVVFDGTIVTRTDLDHALEFLRAMQRDQGYDCSHYKWRQCRAAEQYLMDVFGVVVVGDDSGDDPSRKSRNRGRQHFLTARTAKAAPQDAANWPVQIQGPILFAPSSSSSSLDDNDQQQQQPNVALTIESFGNAAAAGLAVGKENTNVDVGLIVPSALIPRFAHESTSDRHAIDDNIYKASSAWVDRVALGVEWKSRSGTAGARGSSSSSPSSSNCTMSLMPDPVVDTMLHVVVPTAVLSLSSNAVRTATNKLLGKPEPAAWSQGSRRGSSTIAWTTLTTTTSSGPSSSSLIQGAVVTPDTLTASSGMGHRCLVRLKDGRINSVNVNELRYTHELEAMISASEKTSAGSSSTALVAASQRGLSSSSPSSAAADVAVQALESTPPLYESIHPLVEQVQAGLASMGKIVGSETSYKDVTPESLAVVHDVMARCDKEVVLPLTQLQKMIRARRAVLTDMLHSQEDQLESLLQTIRAMQDRTEHVGDRVQGAQENSASLSQRAKLILEACKTHVPTITQAEHDFFEFTELTKIKLNNTWDPKAKDVMGKVQKQIASMNATTATTDETTQQQQPVDTKLQEVVQAQEVNIADARRRLHEIQQRVQRLAQQTGLEPTSENVPANTMM